RFGVGERETLGIEDVRVEQVDRIARQLVRDPRDRPRVQHRIAVVVAREVRGIGGERPRVNGRERDERRERDKARSAHAASLPYAVFASGNAATLTGSCMISPCWLRSSPISSCSSETLSGMIRSVSL